MHMRIARIDHPARAIAVRAHLSAVDLEEMAREKVPRLQDDTGAQAAEYAMLGGVSAAACSGLVLLLRNRETLGTVVEAVTSSLARFVGSWF